MDQSGRHQGLHQFHYWSPSSRTWHSGRSVLPLCRRQTTGSLLNIALNNGSSLIWIVHKVLLFEITRTKARHKRLRDILLPTQAQCLNVISDGRLVVGYPSGFAVYSLMGDQHPLSLVQAEHPSISFIAHHPLDALRAVEIGSQEFLLVFSTLAVYVDYQGRKSREKEIMYPAPPLAIGIFKYMQRNYWRLIY